MRKTDLRPIVIGVSGGSAAGKTTFTDILSDRLADFGPVVLNQDNYFRDWSALPEDEREIKRTANHPRAVLWGPLIAHVKCLREGQAIEMPPPGTRAFRRGDDPQKIAPEKTGYCGGTLDFFAKGSEVFAGYQAVFRCGYTRAGAQAYVAQYVEWDVAGRCGGMVSPGCRAQLSRLYGADERVRGFDRAV